MCNFSNVLKTSFASNISEADLGCYVKTVKNIENNHVAGSIILNFSKFERRVERELTSSMGFRKFVRQALKTQEKNCQQEMRTAFWKMSKQKSSAVQSKVHTQQTNGQGYDIQTSHYLFLFTIGAEACH
jgi:hypothetical protein